MSAANFIKRLFCRHSGGISFVRNLYGDQIIEWGWKRSLWRCKRCGSLFAQEMLNEAHDADLDRYCEWLQAAMQAKADKDEARGMKVNVSYYVGDALYYLLARVRSENTTTSRAPARLSGEGEA